MPESRDEPDMAASKAPAGAAASHTDPGPSPSSDDTAIRGSGSRNRMTAAVARAGGFFANRFRQGARRVRTNISILLQVTVGAAVAYLVCDVVLGHQYPFLAAVAATVGSGVTVDRRVRRATEYGLGATLGVLVGEVFFTFFGGGIWQLAVVLFLGLMIGTMVNSGGIFITQIAVQGIYVVTIPLMPGAKPFDRTFDALVGALVALLLALIVPSDARKVPRERASSLLQEISELLRAGGVALETNDRELAQRTLERARDSQAMVDSWRTSVRIAQETARINARGRRHAAEVTRLARACEYADRSIRLVRVILRRIIGMTEVKRPRMEVGSILTGLGSAVDLLRGALRRGESRTTAEKALEEVAQRLTPQNPKLLDLQDETLVLLLRPLLTDMLGACGVSEKTARDALPDLVTGPENPKGAASGHTVVRVNTETLPMVQVDDSTVTARAERAGQVVDGGRSDGATRGQESPSQERPAGEG